MAPRADSGDETAPHDAQLELGAFGRPPEPDRTCAAIAVSTSRRCQRDTVAGTAYCGLHIMDLYEASD